MKIPSLLTSLQVVILILGESLYVHSHDCQQPQSPGFTQALCAPYAAELVRRSYEDPEYGGVIGAGGGNQGKNWGNFPGGTKGAQDIILTKPTATKDDNKCVAPADEVCCRPDVKAGTRYHREADLYSDCDYVH
ncbi:hypothetical protein MJO28_014923 [Puccinia striiformis f. sp. tritici]|uniref:Secreted protein n=4 Tax=Puccinia striiformis TaxID=27350 RepID=A0A0L0VE49_9BASI|nr:hypothetical protein Pst134EA_027784 [Puccinia striiformis f. sp. tritici]KAI9608110.1 hypothetical protein H4Q26_005566 [Puccinia striiformis f. sp. tritici PST-130]KNE97587.1 hypothetical protein PSTG_09135 [Puccinia striiformis f. sp. tritici PST-78]POW03824.1 hypothetical protein PSHT_11489 [Puccinia striiformis]KAH9442079.1 hypothetical protein Pst134EB_028348 [Puccinia striiformis f. sp. tritici]KAH9448474.1 hypothetical protein Pst134EA_027784 [Puccinia striiformis f. sp. tritici]